MPYFGYTDLISNLVCLIQDSLILDQFWFTMVRTTLKITTEQKKKRIFAWKLEPTTLRFLKYKPCQK